ncbi:MAG: DMT family transporter, partial [Acidobacteria bacterium]|nr:DMT family transporter [Acidobacteriota bacterium]
MSNHENLKVYAAGILRCTVFGSAFIAMKIALKSINPMMLIFLRYFICVILLNVFVSRFYQKQQIKKKDYKYLIILGLIEPFIFYILDAYGLKYTTAVRAALILAITPVIVAVLAVPFLKEKLTFIKLVSAIGSVIGVFIVVTASEPIIPVSEYLLGDVLLIGAALFHALFTLLSRKLSFTYNPLTITQFQSVVGLVGFLPLAVVETSFNGFVIPDTTSIISVLYLGIVVSTFGFLLVNYTISRLSAANSSIFQNLTPGVAMILSFLLLGEYIGIQKIVGFILISSFVFLISWYER